MEIMTSRFRHHYERMNSDVDHHQYSAGIASTYGHQDNNSYYPANRIFRHEDSYSSPTRKNDFNHNSINSNEPLFQRPPADWSRQHQWGRRFQHHSTGNAPYYGHRQHANDRPPENVIWNRNVDQYKPSNYDINGPRNGTGHAAARSHYFGSSAMAGHTQPYVGSDRGTHSQSTLNVKAIDHRRSGSCVDPRSLQANSATCNSTPNSNAETSTLKENGLGPNINSRNTKLLKCLMCSTDVIHIRIREHLLFGSVQCQSCSWQTSDCKVFSERHNYVYYCTHTSLKWSFLELNDVNIHITNENDRRTFLKEYLRATVALKYYSPFQSAYQHFEQFEKNSSPAAGAKITEELNERVTAVPEPTKTIVSAAREQRCSTDSSDSQKENLEDLLTFEQSKDIRVINDDKCAPVWRNKTVIKMKKLVVAKLNDKHQTLLIGPAKPETERVLPSKETPVTVARRNVQETLALLPKFIRDQKYVVTCVLRDYCPQCYTTINTDTLTIFLESSLTVAQCGKCSLYVCYRERI